MRPSSLGHALHLSIEAAKLARHVTSARRTDSGVVDPRPEPLLRAIGTLGLAAAIVNITVGGGIFRLPSSVAGSLGAAAPIAYVVCAVAMGLIVLCIADAGSRVSLTGGPYAYVGAALGPYAAFLSGVLLWMLGLFATAAVATVFAASVGLLVPALAPWQPIVLLVTFAFWSLVNMRGVALGARLNSVATVAKLLPLLLIAVGGLFLVRSRAPAVTAWPAAADVARTSLLLMFVFAGIESRSCRAARCGIPRAPCRARSRWRWSASRRSTSRCRSRRRGFSAALGRPTRRWPMPRARLSAAGRARCCSPAPRYRCSAISAA